MELDTEKFKALKELSDLQTSVVATGAELKKLREELSQYKAEREEEALAVVHMALLASREAIAEAEKNKDVVASLLVEAQQVFDTVVSLSDTVTKLADRQKEVLAETKQMVKVQTENLEQKTKEIQKQRMYVEDGLANLAVRKKKLGEQEQKLFADMEALKRDMERINRVNK